MDRRVSCCTATQPAYRARSLNEFDSFMYIGILLLFLCSHEHRLRGNSRNFDVRHLILNRHQSLFDRGLNETYFDVVMEHFVATLKDMNIDPSVIHEAMEVISPLRPIFVQGAVEAAERKKQLRRKDVMTETTVFVVVFAMMTAMAVRFLKNQTQLRR